MGKKLRSSTPGSRAKTHRPGKAGKPGKASKPGKAGKLKLHGKPKGGKKGKRSRSGRLSGETSEVKSVITPGAKGFSGKDPVRRAAGKRGRATYASAYAPEAKKRKLLAPQAGGTERASEDAEAAEEGGKRKKKVLTPRQQRRKEVTRLYSELTDPGRSRKANTVVGEILKVLSARASTLAQYCSKEIGSRVVQACLKWGDRQQRSETLELLKEELVKLATDRYGHVLVLKLLRYCTRTASAQKPTEEEKRARGQHLREFLEAFRGRSLQAVFYHRYGCRVVNGLYSSPALPPKERRRILQELALPSSLSLTLPEQPGSLEAMPRRLLGCQPGPQTQQAEAAALTPEQRRLMLQHLQECLERAVDKELLAFDLVHLLFQAFCEAASESQLKELAEKCMAGAPYLLSSRPGAEALLRLLGFATAKQKRELCRELKGKFLALATNAVDYVVLMRMASTVDDTVLLGKTMLAECSSDLAALVFDRYGHRLLAWLLQPDAQQLFSPAERQSLALPAPTSLKAAETRRSELLRLLQPPLRGLLLEDPLRVTGDAHGKQVLLAYLAADWDAGLLEALLVAGAAEQPEAGELGRLSTGTAVSTLIALVKLQPQAADFDFARGLWQRCLAPRLPAAVTSRCAFVLLAILKLSGPLGQAVLLALRQQRVPLEESVRVAEKGGQRVDGAKKLLGELDVHQG